MLFFAVCGTESPYHGVVFQLGLPQRRGVASNDDELSLARSQTLERRLVAECDFSGLHHKRQARAMMIVRILTSNH